MWSSRKSVSTSSSRQSDSASNDRLRASPARSWAGRAIVSTIELQHNRSSEIVKYMFTTYIAPISASHLNKQGWLAITSALMSCDMTQMRRWLVAFAALAIGGVVSGALLFLGSPARDSIDVFVAARDLPAGAALGPDVLALQRISVSSARSLLFRRGDEPVLAGMRATHDLASGQLIQRSDVMDSSSSADRRLVFVPVKDVPLAVPGSKVDLLVIGGTADHLTVIPFALAVEVRSNVSGGLIVVVGSKQAAAFVYAASAMHLAAVIAEPGAAGGAERPISSPDQALAAAAQP